MHNSAWYYLRAYCCTEIMAMCLPMAMANKSCTMDLDEAAAASRQNRIAIVKSMEWLGSTGIHAQGLLYFSTDMVALSLISTLMSKGSPLLADDASECLRESESGFGKFLRTLSARVHHVGEPDFPTDAELEAGVDFSLRYCWRTDACAAYVAKAVIVGGTHLVPDLSEWALAEGKNVFPNSTGSVTVLILAPADCTPLQVGLYLAPPALQFSAEKLDFTVVEITLRSVTPGVFEQFRAHVNLSRWLPPFPGMEPYTQQPVYGFGDECKAGAVGPTDAASSMFQKIFGRVLCSPSVRSRPQDFEGPAAGLRIHIADVPSAFNSDRLVVASLVRLAYGYSCDAGFFLCSEQEWDGSWSSWRQHTTEAVLLQKFLTAPPGVLVEKPSDADIIIVPILTQFVHAWHMFERLQATACPGKLLPHMPHLQLSLSRKQQVHVFILAEHMSALKYHDTAGLLSLFFQHSRHFMLSYGTEWGTSGHASIPPVVTDPDLQPGELSVGDELERTRDIFLFHSDTPNCCHPIRQVLYDFLSKDIGRVLCGPSCVVVSRSRPHDVCRKSQKAGTTCNAEIPRTHGPVSMANSEYYETMRRATFCTVTPGDLPYRYKFTHAILAGCIPVVFAFPSFFRGHESWTNAQGAPYEFSVPFPEDIGYNFVVRVPCTTNYTESAMRLISTLHALTPLEIRKRKAQLLRSRNLLGYSWNGTVPDAFTASMERIARFVRSNPLLR